MSGQIVNISDGEEAYEGYMAVPASGSGPGVIVAHPTTTVSKVGIVGYCMGGQLSLYAACENPNIGACIDFYGIHPNVQPVLRDLYCPLLGIFAEHDDYASPAQVQALDAELTSFGKQFQFVTYPGTHHAFCNDTRPAHDPEAAADAWRRSTEFLNENLS